jgi:hypothetical protein
MLDSKLPWLTLVIAVIAAGLCVVLSMHITALKESHLRYVAEVERDKAVALAAASAQATTWQQQKEEARNEADRRIAQLAADLRAARRAGDGLRDELAALRSRLDGAPIAACLEANDTLATLLGSCEGEYRDMAAAAQGHADDVRTLITAWPVVGGF